MPLPPMFFSIYQIHVRLPEPGLHAQPLVQTPPMFHLEGLHFVQWLFSKMDNMSSTVRGDCMRFALKDHDSAKFIPHLPLPAMAGPFLIDTLKNSQYVVLPHQPNVKLDKKEVGIFFWIIASPWRCIELPAPKFVSRFTAKGVSRQRIKSITKARDSIAKAKAKIDELEKAKDVADALSPDEFDEMRDKFDYDFDYEKNEKAIEAEKQKIKETEESQKEESAKLADARRYAWDSDKDAGKPPPGENKEQRVEREQRQEALEHDAGAEDQFEKVALAEKKAADSEARAAKKAAADHEAKAQSNYRKAAGGGGLGSGSADEGAAHEAKALEQRNIAEKAEARSKAAEATAKEHAKNARQSRRGLGERQHRQQGAKEYAAKHAPAEGKKPDNPYAMAKGTGNVGILAPSILAHIPFPCTVFIHQDILTTLKNFGLNLLGQGLLYVKGVLGFVFDSLGAGRGVLGQAAAALGKAVSDMLFDSAKDFATEGKVGFKLSMKQGPVTVSASLTQGSDGKWSWKTSGKVEKGKLEAEISREQKVAGETKDGKTTESSSTTTSGTIKYGDVEGSASTTDSKSTTTEGDKVVTEESTSRSASVKGKQGDASFEGSYGEESKTTTTDVGGEKSVEKSDTTTMGGKAEREDFGSAGYENKSTKTTGPDGDSTETSHSVSADAPGVSGSASSSHKESHSAADGKEVATVTDSSSSSGRIGPVDQDNSSETTRTTTATTDEGPKVETETTTTTTENRTGSPGKYDSSKQSTVDYSHDAPTCIGMP
ncbi:MAG TPA: hypothetical protein VMG12_09780 [Polyangiaceae bacterium]|nr:hypothetical protein [Polyangiaceae bacterium]